MVKQIWTHSLKATLPHFHPTPHLTLASSLPLSCAQEGQIETQRAPQWPWSSGRSSFCCSPHHHWSCFGEAALENPGSQSGGWKHCCHHPSWILGPYPQTDRCCSPVGPLEASSVGYEEVLSLQHPAYPGGLHGTTTQPGEGKFSDRNHGYDPLVWRNVSFLFNSISQETLATSKLQATSIYKAHCHLGLFLTG